jgi:integrase
MELQQLLKRNKPDSSEKTMKEYISNLNLLYKNMTGDKKFDMETFNNFTTDELVACVNKEGATKSHSYTRNMLSALKAYSGDKTLTKPITEAALAEKENYENREASEYVKSHHLTPEVIEAKYQELEARSIPLWIKKDWDMKDFQNLQEFIMYNLVCGKYIAPRRSQDWIHFKLRNIDLDKDNYLEGKTFVFNQFKTSKHIGRQVIPIPDELYRIIRKWARFNQLDYMFVTAELKPLTSNSFGQKLNHIMGVPAGRTGGYGTNNFRHVYLTNKYANTIDLADDMKAMGSSIECAKCYIKKV